nr:MAG TPA: hypothetical protein [Caudoviricetes sp.]
MPFEKFILPLYQKGKGNAHTSNKTKRDENED